MELKDIEKKFANQVNQYYAHGIGVYDEKVIKSIFENGLKREYESYNIPNEKTLFFSVHSIGYIITNNILKFICSLQYG